MKAKALSKRVGQSWNLGTWTLKGSEGERSHAVNVPCVRGLEPSLFICHLAEASWQHTEALVIPFCL